MKKQRWQESEKKQEDHAEKRKSQKKEDAGARKGRKVAKHVFSMSWGSGGSKSRLLHATVARSTFSNQKVLKTNGLGALLEVETSKKSTPLWREAHFQVKSVKT